MKKDYLTDEQVEREIERLSESEAVRLARLEQRIKNRRRQYMYQLRWIEKRGKQLLKDGITEEDLLKLDVDIEEDDSNETI